MIPKSCLPFALPTCILNWIECLHTLETFPPDYMEGFMLTWNPFFAIFTFSFLWWHSVSSVYCRVNQFFSIKSVKTEITIIPNMGFPHSPAESGIWHRILLCPISRWLLRDPSNDMVCFVIPGSLFCHSSVSNNQWWRSHVLFLFFSPCIFELPSPSSCSADHVTFQPF